MKTLSAFFVSSLLPLVLQAQGPRFVSPPVIEGFGSGGFEWTASVSCVDPVALLGARILFSFDTDLDGVGDTSGVFSASIAATLLSPGDCVNGVLSVRRPFVLAAPAVLRAELWLARNVLVGASTAGDSLVDRSSLLTGSPGSLLSLRTFCARPRNGEPEWVEVKNVSSVTVSLNHLKLEGRALSGSPSSSSSLLDPGESLTAYPAADSAEMRLWRPGARTLPLVSWPGLRNSGDTVRLMMETVEAKSTNIPVRTVSLDSVAYGAAGGWAREACASAPTEESTAAAHGFGIDIPAGGWRRNRGPLAVKVTAPDSILSVEGGTGSESLGASKLRAYDLIVYDLDGFALCRLARRARGSQTYSLSPGACPQLRDEATALILLLRPSEAPSVRRLVRVIP